MSRPNPGYLALALAALLAVAAVLPALRGGLYLTSYEGDALHLADVALRMAGGQRPHLDFMTPLGLLAFWPVTAFMAAGLPLWAAFLAAQAALAALLLPALWWLGISRLPAPVAYGFGAAVLLTVLSVSFGDNAASVTLSMHYNRWAWAIAFLAAALALLPPDGGERPWPDGLVIGAALAALAFLKITYAVAFAPGMLLALIAGGRLRTLGAAAAGAALVLALVLVAGGPGLPLAYLADLRAAMAADLRDQPGLPFASIAVAPPYLAGTVAAFLGAYLIRRDGARAEGLGLLLLLPGFLLVAWQNFGNHPLWLVLVAAVLVSAAPGGKPARPGAMIAGFAALVLALPQLQSLALGAPRHLTLAAAGYEPLVPGGDARLAGLFVAEPRARLVYGRDTLIEPGRPFAALGAGQEAAEPLVFAGAVLPGCQLGGGVPGAIRTLGADPGLPAAPTFVADTLSAHWLFGPQPPLAGGAPWNYGTLSGIGAADYLLVPLCPVSEKARRAILERVSKEGIAVEPAGETPLYRLYRLPDQGP